jgi:ribosome maturation factor RimP
VSERLTDLLAPVVEDAGLVLEDVAVTPAGRRRVVRVVVDLPEDATGSVDLDAVAEVSRVVAEALDAGDALGESPYVLEVTSPGVDRPLTQRRHWSRARGRLVTVPVAATEQEPASEITGRVRSVGDDGVLMDTGGADRLLGWDRLGHGRVEVEFNRPDEQEA